jgi:hypothetical protein
MSVQTRIEPVGALRPGCKFPLWDGSDRIQKGDQQFVRQDIDVQPGLNEEPLTLEMLACEGELIKAVDLLRSKRAHAPRTNSSTRHIHGLGGAVACS